MAVRTGGGRRRDLAAVHIGVGVVLGGCVAAGAALLGAGWLAPLVGWDVAALAIVAWTWLSVRGMDAEATARHATREDPTRPVSDVILLVASAASLVAVGFVIVRAGQAQGGAKAARAALGAASVVVSWLVVHTTYLLRYARTYHGDGGGVDFNQHAAPRYTDFAYLTFTIGMTFQVSDTSLSSSAMRGLALRHALLSYLYGTGIIATTINLIINISQ